MKSLLKVHILFIILKAVSFGKSFLDDFNHDLIKDMCVKLKILNCVRNSIVGFPICFMEYTL